MMTSSGKKMLLWGGGILLLVFIVAIAVTLGGSVRPMGSRVSVSTGPMMAAGVPTFQYAVNESGSGMMNDAKGVIIAPMPPQPYPTAGETAADVDQKIIKTGNLQLVATDVADAAKRIGDIAAAHKGFVQASALSETGDGSHAGTVTIRVPSDGFDAAMSEIKSLATLVRNESVTGQDVTEQYTDLQAQLRNAQAQEDTYLAILKQSKTVSDTLAVQAQLGAIRGQIESLQGRIQYLQNVTSYSTISAYVEEDATVRAPTKEFRPVTIIKEAAQVLIQLLQGLATLIIWLVVIFIGLMVPLLLFIWLIVWLVLRSLRRFWKI